MTENSKYKNSKSEVKKRTAQPEIAIKIILNIFQTQEKHTMPSSFPKG
jgi:hypothetical protein